VHVVKQILSLLSTVAIASCGTMPVPGIGESKSDKPVEVVDAAPVSQNKLEKDNSPIEQVNLQDIETSPKKDAPDTTVLASETETAEIANSTANPKNNKPTTPNNEPIDLAEANKTFDYFVTPDGLIKEVPDSTQIVNDREFAEVTTALNQKPDSKKSNNNTTKSVTNQDQEVKIQLALANRYYKSAKYQNAIDLLETPVSSNKKNEELRDLLLLSYSRYAKELVRKANLLEAQTVLEKAVSIEPNNSGLQNQLKKIKNTREANRIYQLGLAAVNSGDKIGAFKSFQEVLVLKPSHSMAKQQVAKIRAPVIESRYKEAMQHYRKQELTDAIQAWDDVLEMDPSHELAKLYRSRAAELKQKIDVFD